MLKRLFTRAALAYAHDVLMAGGSFLASLYLRLGDEFAGYPPATIATTTALFVIVSAVILRTTGLYRGVWRYASLDDLAAIVRAVTLSNLVFLPVLFLLTRAENLPRSVLVIDWFVLIMLLGSSRFAYRLYRDRRLTLRGTGLLRDRIPVLLIGAGDGAELFIRNLSRDGEAAYRAVGVVDEKGTRVGREIHGVPVLGRLDELADIVKRLGAANRAPQRLILTKEHLERDIIRQAFDAADRLGLPLSTLPRLTDFRDGMPERAEIRPIAIEDLLGRPQTVLDRDGMRRLIAGKRVLVTGAGGTIGSELVRQICAFAPAHVDLLDHGEFALYSIDLEAGEKFPHVSRAMWLADVRDRARIMEVFAGKRPELVFHAAALKHVPMVELNPAEGVLTNVIGTRNVGDACRAAGTATMVLISTDKAVNPTSVMGATKRVAEAYCQSLDVTPAEAVIGGMARGRTRFVTVRFGNVLGSTGSVVPLFQRQLAAGGPVTVTHPDVTRYFMTVREAVELVLQASVLGATMPTGGRIFVLDMGEPVRIADLARQMIRLAGLRPEIDIEIVYTGLRAGEKLYEELLHASEKLADTPHSGILLAAPRVADAVQIVQTLGALETAARTGRVAETKSLLSRLAPEFASPAAPAADPIPGLAAQR